MAFTVDAARDLTYTIRVQKHERRLAHRLCLSLTWWALGCQAHLSGYVSATPFSLCLETDPPPAVLQCKRGGRTYRSDLRANKYVKAPVILPVITKLATPRAGGSLGKGGAVAEG